MDHMGPCSWPPPSLVLIVSTQRGASTETAEAIAAHPCATSWNELLLHAHFPKGYNYPQGSLQDLLNVSRLRHATWLADALAVRRRVCSTRPKALVDACGDVCVVALKMHLNNYIASATDGPWLELVTSEHVRAIVVERDGLETYCSILRAKRTGDWGHTPQAHTSNESRLPCVRSEASERCGWRNESRLPCVRTEASERFVADVRARFAATRSALRGANRTWLELPFATYVANPSAAAARMRAFVGLQDAAPRAR